MVATKTVEQLRQRAKYLYKIRSMKELKAFESSRWVSLDELRKEIDKMSDNINGLCGMYCHSVSIYKVNGFISEIRERFFGTETKVSDHSTSLNAPEKKDEVTK